MKTAMKFKLNVAYIQIVTLVNWDMITIKVKTNLLIF